MATRGLWRQHLKFRTIFLCITVYFTHTQNRPHVTANANAIRYVGNPWITQLGGFAIQHLIMVSGNSMSQYPSQHKCDAKCDLFECKI